MLALTDSDFNRIVTYIKSNYGINLIKKRTLIEGRLSNMIVGKGFNDFTSYFDYIFNSNNKEELTTLVNKLTTNHTYFLREPEHFEFLKSTVLPYIKSSVKDRDVRIWCAASSSGQEPYTMAMIIDEFFGAEKSLWDTRILATDISTDVLIKAKLGIYSAEMIQDVPDAWVKKYFNKLPDGRYQVIDRIRKEIAYKQFNLMDDIKYKKPFDLISCRNVMIYFDMQTKNSLIERLYDATKPGGYLFIGHAENISKDTKYKFIKPAVYRRPL